MVHRMTFWWSGSARILEAASDAAEREKSFIMMLSCRCSGDLMP